MQTILTLGNALNQGTARGRVPTTVSILIYIVLLKYVLEVVIDELGRLTRLSVCLQRLRILCNWSNHLKVSPILQLTNCVSCLVQS